MAKSKLMPPTDSNYTLCTFHEAFIKFNTVTLALEQSENYHSSYMYITSVSNAVVALIISTGKIQNFCTRPSDSMKHSP